MSQPDPRIEAFFAEAPLWRAELAALRAILLDGGLSEEWKWRSPCYTAGGANVALLWGFKEECRLGFFKGVLLKDPKGLLVAPGENSRSSRTLNFSSVAEVERHEDVIRAYLAEAIAIEEAGLKVDLPKDDLNPPEELTAMLDAAPDLRAAFEALTPGRRRGWILHFSQPKQPATRRSRIEKAAPRILAGKGMHDR
ncbi:YdeI/OmpD-associated family protein [Aquibium sp. ELW1220]|jgi:uncharacterized protein YdeI (YjbR/CyaY-like superfamily)|uniref:YdeI/OmpD-associated family protein n=1 Tax=Aquibium sp. ELW1220 TaxID=2976766 RepID=UPI0025AFAB4C|nr:YdeI/OmpD-associated family protein [Aquibium sp. ELW1220]MDN2578645.1 YdeI/OmpD-associated family protein [Aquibium sp. ELW1220]